MESEAFTKRLARYTDPAESSYDANAQYNGNIAAMQWRTNLYGSCRTLMVKYGFVRVLG